MTRVQKSNIGDGQTKWCFSNEKKGHFWYWYYILFQGQKTKQKRRDLAKIFRSKVLGTRPPSAIAVCLSVMMVVWECCTRNRWQGHIYHWKVGLKSTKPHTFFICDVVVGGCAVLYSVPPFLVCNLEICGFLEDIQHLQVDRVGTCHMKNGFSSQNLLNLLNSQRDKWNRVQALMLWNLLKRRAGLWRSGIVSYRM